MVFFLSQKEKEIPDILKKDPAAKKAYNEILSGLEKALMLYIYDSGPYPSDEGAQILPFSDLAIWAEADWKLLYPKFEKKRWIIVYVARGGFQLVDLIENRIDDFVWTYFKPKTEIREFEDSSIYSEYSDPTFEDKFADYMEENTSILFVDDVISTGENLEATFDITMEIAEEYNVEVGDVATFALISRIRNLGTMPIYGVQTDIQIDLRCSWGNDLPDRIDARDFSENKEYIDDH
jgi:hypoxanthine phosphoribosyltransferase